MIQTATRTRTAKGRDPRQGTRPITTRTGTLYHTPVSSFKLFADDYGFLYMRPLREIGGRI